MTFLLLTACSIQRRTAVIRRESPVIIVRAGEDAVPGDSFREILPRPDTLTVEDDGKILTILKAVKDENGEMTAVDVLDAAYVTARFRNVAERNGKVELRFRITVPPGMTRSLWQIRLDPTLAVNGDTVFLDKVLLTGSKYRKAQLKGYEHYRKFISSIITDTTLLIDRHQLEVFIKRNLPAVYAFSTDSSSVSGETFSAAFGVGREEAVRHYMKAWVVNRNNRRLRNRDRMFEKFVKAPLVSEGVRLDSVLVDENGVSYEYVQPLEVTPRTKRADVIISGNICEGGESIYRIPSSDPVTFYISSLGTLMERKVRYRTEVIYRKVSAQKSYAISFRKGDHRVDGEFSGNGPELKRIKADIQSAVAEDEFTTDSLIITSSCSPEGSFKTNSALARMRAVEVSGIVKGYFRQISDSAAIGFSVEGDGRVTRPERPEPVIIPRSIPEDWESLSALVASSRSLLPEWKETYSRTVSQIEDPDERENMLRGSDFYPVLYDSVYPLLRSVRMEFCLTRKGMVKDTLHTTVPDTGYAEGLSALEDGEYAKAASILRPYKDYNSALAHCAAGNDASALEILERLPQDGRVCYLLSVLYSRKGEIELAVRKYLDACKIDKTYVHRGNLDPEISSLIKTYNLNNETLQ